MKNLKPCRVAIDAIDDAIVDLLSRRFEIVDQVVEVKQAHGIPVRIPARIEEVIERTVARAECNRVPAELIRRIYEDIVETTCRFEESHLEQDEA